LAGRFNVLQSTISRLDRDDRFFAASIMRLGPQGIGGFALFALEDGQEFGRHSRRAWEHLSRKTLKNDLRVFEGLTVSILRNGREVFAGPMPKLTTRHSVANRYRIQIEFSGVLDEAFGVAANKQGACSARPELGRDWDGGLGLPSARSKTN
jgi:hypothetical protein